MLRINKEKLGGAIRELKTTEPEDVGDNSCSCNDPSSCGIDKGCKQKNGQEDT